MLNYDKSIFSKRSNVAIILLFFSLFIISCGYIYYLHEENLIRTGKQNELKAIAHLKINQIEQWKQDKTADAVVITCSPFFGEAVESFLKQKSNKLLEEELINRLILTTKEMGYQNIFLSDTSGKLIFSAKPDLPSFTPYTSSMIKETVLSGRITYTDFYYCTSHHKIHYDLIAPISNKQKRTIAVLVFRIDPSTYLYPLIQTWPTNSKTSETLLIKREGDSILYLNELRHSKNSLLKLKIPLTKTEVPAVKAVLGYKGAFEGRDYRGVEVLAYIYPVPGTPWFMVAKVDKKEIFSDLYFKAFAIISLVILSILFVWAGLAFIYNYKQKNIYKTLWQIQQEARITLYSIGDGVLITDNKGCVKQLNPVAEQLTGWKEEDAISKNFEEIFNIIHEETRNRVENPINKVLKDGAIVELANHTLLISKNGTEIPIADSGAPIKNQDGEILGAVLVFRDQTRERNKQKALEESEAKYKSLFSSTNDGICLHELVLDKDGTPVNYIIIDVNKKYEQITGIKKENIVGKKATEVYQSKFAPYLDIYSDTALTGKPNYFETFYEPMGKHFQISVYSPGYGKFATVFQDITIRKNSLEALRQSEQRLKRAQEIAHLGSWELDLLKNHLTWTDEVYRIFGLEPQEFEATYEAFLNAIHPDDRDVVNDAYSGSIRDGKNKYEIEHRIMRKASGEIRFVHEKCEHFRDESGRVIKSIGMIHDISERKRNEQALVESEEKLKAAQAMAHLGSFSFEIDKWLVECSEEFFRIIGRDPKRGNPFLEDLFSLVHPDDLNRVKSMINDAIEKKININEEFRIIRNHDEIRYIQIFGYPVEDRSGKIIRLFGAILDITDRKKIELQLQDTLNELQRSNRDLEQFAYIASHDLQEPLRMIKSYTDLLIRRYSQDFDADQKDFFTFISDGAIRMHQLVNALLQYSRLTTDKKEFELVDCNEILTNVMKDLKVTIEDSQAVINYNELPNVTGNKTMIRQLFQNLIQNAIKFRGIDSPKVEICSEEKDGYCLFTIKDNGIGISPLYHDKIFMIFQRLHDRTKYPGTGIGLAVCKKIIEHHGGKIYLDSTEGKGTTFYFTLPCNNI